MKDHSAESILERTRNEPAIRSVLERLLAGERALQVKGLSAPLKSLLSALIYSTGGRNVLIICPAEPESEEMSDNLRFLLPVEEVLHLPVTDVVPYERRFCTAEIMGSRIETLARMSRPEHCILVTSVAAVIRRFTPPKLFHSCRIVIEKGGECDPDTLLKQCFDMGYERRKLVDETGTMARRGGIFDIFSLGNENPLRMEFFGNVLETIREFDLITQRSVKTLDRAVIHPFREYFITRSSFEEGFAKMGNLFRERELRQDDSFDMLRKDFLHRTYFPGYQWYIPFFQKLVPLFDYLPEDIILLRDEPALAKEKEREQRLLNAERFRDSRDRGEPVASPDELYIGGDLFEELLRSFQRVDVSLVGEGFGSRRRKTVQIAAGSPSPVRGDVEMLRGEIAHLTRNGYSVHVLCSSERVREEMIDSLHDSNIPAECHIGDLSKGFLLPDAGLAVFTDRELSGRSRLISRHRRFKIGRFVSNPFSIKRGDYLVHIDHGIGRYSGLVRLELDGKKTDCLSLEYRDGDRLYVPVDQMNLVQKYSSREGIPPRIDRIGSKVWEKLKKRTKKAIEELARELIELYASRKVVKGYRFSDDSVWQKELEESFSYDDTADQVKSSLEIKRDMSSDSPMDRLLCGDVGYGKTEVAIRAAFKAVNDSRQVAVLVPTTVLARQHYETFRERMAQFPVTVEMLSRFRTKSYQGKILKDLAEGKIDIIIGTHRLLSKDVTFRELGLVIIDEEQRFGVKHKEKLKQLRKNVDVLTMTATPIPRTLHMALTGIRDMSKITTAPPNRFSIHTEIIEFDKDFVAEAIRKEMDRGGQIFFVHNRVMSIDAMASYLDRIVPFARIGVAHGQMPARKLERVMTAFMKGRYDVLVCTMIIESGLDFPNANTIVVNRADTFGLAQLYQIRGRVGRSNVQSYAYLLIPKRRLLTDIARRRLSAILEFSYLGSGFDVSMRDLDIRGAGNILGTQQSGHIHAVGFETYCRLLEETIREIRGERTESVKPVKVEVTTEAFLPKVYIEDADDRMAYYRRLNGVNSFSELVLLREEIQDQYGTFPPEASNLFLIKEIQILGSSFGTDEIRITPIRLTLYLPDAKALRDDSYKKLFDTFSERLEIGGKDRIEIRILLQHERDVLEESKKILQKLASDDID
jgi:transcription-repair coupling factor (superfamily II helicase)